MRATEPCPHTAGVKKSLFSLHSDAFRARLIALRRAAGLTQRQLAVRVQRPRSFVSRIEQGERRLDVIEFFWVCQACGADPEKVASELMRQFKAVDRRSPGLGLARFKVKRK